MGLFFGLNNLAEYLVYGCFYLGRQAPNALLLKANLDRFRKVPDQKPKKARHPT
jgi:hypothetical protein